MDKLGEDDSLSQSLLSSFSCKEDEDIEVFLREKALEFETQWLDFKKTKWGFSNKKDIERLKKFEKIIK